MATGSYGTIRPADVSPQDVEIILNYTPSRDETDNFVLTTLEPEIFATVICLVTDSAAASTVSLSPMPVVPI